jgi:hypothetical protein
MIIVNSPHEVNHDRLPHVDDRILRDLISLRQSGHVAPARLRLAGVPELPLLEAESRRRANSRPERWAA